MFLLNVASFLPVRSADVGEDTTHNIHAPDRKVPRRAHKLDDVMIVVKNAIFKGRNTTGSLDFNSFKRKMTEIVNKDFADNVANEFVSKIKEAVAG